MKTIVKAAIVAVSLLAAVHVDAQEKEKKDTTSLTHKAGKTAKDVGNKTSEVASKGSSDVLDKEYKGKYGPNGQTVYINNKSQYYYVDKKGHRVYLKKSDLTDKKM